MNGYIIWRSRAIVAIATGFNRPSSNRKTGRQIQVWILNASIDPVSAAQNGRDSVVCGDCPLRGVPDRKVNEVKERACYVNIGQAPFTIWQAWKRGAYKPLPSVDVFNGRSVRFGAYGDPVKIPLPLIRSIASTADSFTGYTHQWRQSWAQGYREFLMASADSAEDSFQAQRIGWRTFRIGQVGISGEVECLNASHGITCDRCQLCAGTSKPAKSIWIRPHGNGTKYLQ